MHTALRALRQLALVRTQDELDLARMEAADVFDQAGWEKSARLVVDSIGLTIASNDRTDPSR